MDLDTLDPAKVTQVVMDTNNTDFDGLLSNIGLGNAMSFAIAHQLADGELSTSSDSNVAIKGAEGMLVSYANCCRPIPGDPIIAHLSPGKGLVIHIASCANIMGFEREKDKYLNVQWDKEADDGTEYLTTIRVDMINHQGILAAVTTAIANAEANIHAMNTDEKEGKIYTVNATISVKNRIHMANVLRRVRVLPDVIKVLRTKH